MALARARPKDLPYDGLAAVPRPLPAPVSLVQQAFREHAAFVAKMAHRLTGRSQEVDDIVQDVFIVAVRGAGALRDPTALRHWLATITVRVARKRLRTLRLRRFCGVDDAPEYERVAAPGATPEDQALLTRVFEILDTVSVNHRVAWSLRHVEGYDLEVVAELCGCSLATAKRWIGAAHAKLEAEVNDD
jgi:RNA polymerase sigma-70 factor (ECF subfamily)